MIASNIAGISACAVAQLKVYPSPTLAQALTNQVVEINSTVVLEVRVLGDSPLSYAWQLNGQAIAGSGPALVLTAIEAP